VLLAWAGGYVFLFTITYAWHCGRAQAEKRVTEEIRRWDDSLNSTEILRHLRQNADQDKRILDVSETLLRVTSDMNRTVGHLLDMEVKRMGEFWDDPPVGPTLVS